MLSKKEIRQEMIQKRKNLTKNEVVTKSSLICNKIINSECYKNSSVIYCYCSINNEVSLKPLMEHALNCGKIVALPKVENNNIQFYSIKSFDELSAGYYNIPEPNLRTAAPKGELLIVPGVAFSNDGNRLGYGGGFYDRFLSNNDILSIGVCYDFQIIENIPVMKHDKKINMIISN
ncbi:MAG: 5-formyltetrahydrofolate cyclo-ligase [Eubacterium sp.]